MTVRRNLKVTGISSLVSFVLNFISVIVVSRLLAPSEIGIYSVSVAFLGIAHVFREFGVSQYLIQVKKLGDEQFREAFSVTLYSSWVISGVLFLLRYPLADIYGHSGVAEILGLLSINFIILPFGTPLLSLLRRNLQFNKLAVNIIIGSVVQTTVTIGCALAGESYLSMAWGALAAQIAYVLFLNYLCPGKVFILPTIKNLREVFNFGSITTLRSIIAELGGSAPDMIFGKTLGFVDVAFFSRAVGLKKMIIQRLNSFVRKVYFPHFANSLRKEENAAQLYCLSINYLVSITTPTLVILAILSEPLIVFLFGPQWKASAPLASLLCLYSVLTAPYALYASSIIAAGRVSLSLFAEIVIQSTKVLILLTSFWLDLEQVVWLLVVAFLMEAIVSQFVLNKVIDLKFSFLMKEIRSSLLLIPFSAIGPGLVVYMSYTFNFSEYRLFILALSGFLACIGWILGVFVTQHIMKKEVISIFKKYSTNQ